VKRHPAFQDLSRDHYVALNRCLQATRAVEGHPAARPFDVARSQLADLWEHDGLQAHFAEEEADLVPVLRGEGGADLASRMVAEHADLRRRFASLAQAAPAEVQEAARLLTAHARWEEEVVFEWLQSHLPEAELPALLARSRSFRAANGLPVSPPRP
jgi:hypothetical protein